MARGIAVLEGPLVLFPAERPRVPRWVKRPFVPFGVALVSLGLLAGPALLSQSDPGTGRRLVLVTLDGVRIDEVFGGVDVPTLRAARAAAGKGLHDSAAYARFAAETREERRRRLMPFLWGTLLAEHGSIAGDAALGSHVRVSNRQRLSYPGYSELLTGRAHDEVLGNDPGQNPYPTFLEFVASREATKPEDVAVFASWPTIAAVTESSPGALHVNAGLVPYADDDPWVRRLSELQFEAAPPWEGVRADAFTFELALAHLRRHRPRALWIALDETDELAHEGRYEALLFTLHRIDGWLRRLHETLEADPYYRGRTTLVVTTDHGRGRGAEWRHHGASIAGSEDAFVVFADPRSPRRGAWGGGEELRLEQVGATLVGLLGHDWSEARGDVAPAVPLLRALP